MSEGMPGGPSDQDLGITPQQLQTEPEQEKSAEQQQIKEFKIGDKIFPVEQLEIGGKTKNQYLFELEKNNIDFGGNNSYAAQSLDRIQLPSKPEKVNIVILGVKDLGLENNPTKEEVLDAGKRLNLMLCSPEIGPALRLKNKTKDNILVVMPTVFPEMPEGYFTREFMFGLFENKGRLGLAMGYETPSHDFLKGNALIGWEKFAFRVPDKPKAE